MKIIIAGSRRITDRKAIESLIRRAVRAGAKEIVHGDCRGVDRIAGDMARRIGLVVRAMPADWDLHGKKAGPIRNRAMADYADALIVMRQPHGSKGTADMLACMESLGKPIAEYVLHEKQGPVCVRDWSQE